MFGLSQSSKQPSWMMAPQEPPSAFPKKKRGGLGFGTIPNMAKSIWNNGLFGSGPAPSLFGSRNPEEFAIDPTDAMMRDAVNYQSMTYPAYSAPLQAMEAPQPVFQSQQPVPVTPPPSMMLDGAARDHFTMPLPMSGPQVPQLPQFAPMQGFQMPMSQMNTPAMMGQASGLVSQTFGDLSRNSNMENSLMQSAYGDAMNQRGTLMESLAGPLSTIGGAFLGGNLGNSIANAGQQIANRHANRQSNAWNMIGQSDQRSMARGNFADNYARYWDRNSPTNQQNAIGNQLKYQQNYTNAMNAATGQYNAQTTRNLGQQKIDNQASQFRTQQEFDNKKFNESLKQLDITNKRNANIDAMSLMSAKANIQHQVKQDALRWKQYEMGVRQYENKLLTTFGTADPKELAKFAKTNMAAKQALELHKAQVAQRDNEEKNLIKRLEALSKLGTRSKGSEGNPGVAPIDNPYIKAQVNQSLLNGLAPQQKMEQIPPAAIEAVRKMSDAEKRKEAQGFKQEFGVDIFSIK